jgi:superfamily II DNA/RNA helicase
MIQNIIEGRKAQEELSSEYLIGRVPFAPHSVILAPSKELAAQIHSIVQSICSLDSVRGVKVVLLAGGSRKGKQAKTLEKGVDVVIGTPGRVMQLNQEGKLNLGRAKYLVIDEADTMLEGRAEDGRGFLEDVDAIIEKTKAKGESPQIILACATLKTAKFNAIQKKFSGLKPIFGSRLHTWSSNLKTNFVNVGSRDKQVLLVDMLRDHLKKLSSQNLSGTSRTLIFCNTVQSCRSLGHFLDENSISHFSLHGKIMPELRKSNIQGFLQEGDSHSKCPVLVATDVACRGLDFPNVDHVFLFDFPPSVVDFLHRIGRTARASNHGNVSCLVEKGDLHLLEKIQAAKNLNQSLNLDNIDRSMDNFDNNKEETIRAESRPNFSSSSADSYRGRDRQIKSTNDTNSKSVRSISSQYRRKKETYERSSSESRFSTPERSNSKVRRPSSSKSGEFNSFPTRSRSARSDSSQYQAKRGVTERSSSRSKFSARSKSSAKRPNSSGNDDFSSFSQRSTRAHTENRGKRDAYERSSSKPKFSARSNSNGKRSSSFVKDKFTQSSKRESNPRPDHSTRFGSRKKHEKPSSDRQRSSSEKRSKSDKKSNNSAKSETGIFQKNSKRSSPLK